MYERTYGAEYDASMTVKQIAAVVRTRLRAALKAGDLPVPAGNEVKISVRYRTASMMQAIDRTVSGFEGTRSEWAALRKAIDAVANAYNHDGSDIQTDYFDVRFYGSTDYCWNSSTVRNDPCPNSCPSEPEMWTGSMLRCPTCELTYVPGMVVATA